jgi:ubiquinone/menaquinone biosynthesis C-methylase UbiE
MPDAPTHARAVNFDAFNDDAAVHGTYLYNSDRLSCRLATQRWRDTIMALTQFTGRSVIDIGCGDGYNTVQFWDLGKPRTMTAIDPAAQAIAVADANKGERPIHFQVADAHALPFADDSFDLATIIAVLHHDDDARDILREAFRVAPEIVVLEPNGYNFGLKAFERVSRYHREHREKSYTPRLLRRLVAEAGGRMTGERLAGLVPMFCPDIVARCMKAIEPAAERIPLVNACGCAIYVFTARRAS